MEVLLGGCSPNTFRQGAFQAATRCQTGQPAPRAPHSPYSFCPQVCPRFLYNTVVLISIRMPINYITNSKCCNYMLNHSSCRSRRSVRSGYAFAHQEGFGRLITSGKIMRPRNPRQANISNGRTPNVRQDRVPVVAPAPSTVEV